MSPLVLIILIVLPGAWVSFGLRLADMSWKARLALAVALSPVVVGVEVCLLKWVGLSFGHAAWVAVATAAPSIILVLRRLDIRRAFGRWPVGLCGLVLFGLLSTCALFPSLYQPKYRTFARHALLHTDVCYAVSRQLAAGRAESRRPAVALPMVQSRSLVRDRLCMRLATDTNLDIDKHRIPGRHVHSGV